MSIIRSAFERRSLEVPQSSGSWDQGMVWNPAGVSSVSTDSAMRLSAVFACLRLLSEAVSTLPLDTYQRRDGTRVDFPRPGYLTFAPPQGNRIDYLSQTMLSLLTDGNAFIATPRDRFGVPVDLVVIDPVKVEVKRLDNGDIAYVSDGERFTSDEVMHIKGMCLPGSLRGVSPIAYARETIGLGLAAQRFGTSFFENGALPGAVIEAPDGMTQDAADRFSATWNARHQGVGSANRVGVLTGGATLNKVSVTPDDAQFLECVVPGTMVSMADGSRRAVENLVAGDDLVSWDGEKLTTAKVAVVGVPPTKPLITIRTARGRELVASHDHPVLARRTMRTPGGRPASGEEWIPLGELAEGMHVKVALAAPIEPTTSLTPDHAYFLGAMVGDGYIRKGVCSFSCEQPATVEKVDGILATLGGRLSFRSGVDYDVLTNGVGRGGSPTRDLMNESGQVGRHSHTKTVPDLVMTSGPGAWAGFLSGYFDADGSVRDPGSDTTDAAYFSSTSLELLEGCQHLLAMLGVQSSIYPMSAGGPREVMGQECVAKPSWGLYVMGVAPLRALAAELDLTHPEKSRRLKQHLDSPPSRYRDDVFGFDRVTEVEHLGPGETVGVEVEGTHTFVTAGIVTHNTRAFQVPDVARIFGVPPHLIADASNSTSWGSGLQEQNLAFGQFSLRPWIDRIEESHTRMLATHGLRDVFVKLNLDALLRASLKDRYEAAAIGIRSKFLLPNEVRALEDMPPVDGGDAFPTMPGETL